MRPWCYRPPGCWSAHARRRRRQSAPTRCWPTNVTTMERASAVHEGLTAVVLRGGSAGGIADTLNKALGRPVVIQDRELKPAAHAPRDDAIRIGDTSQALLQVVQDAIDESRSTGRCVFATAPGHCQRSPSPWWPRKPSSVRSWSGTDNWNCVRWSSTRSSARHRSPRWSPPAGRGRRSRTVAAKLPRMGPPAAHRKRRGAHSWYLAICANA